jgi:hypothetical protein
MKKMTLLFLLLASSVYALEFTNVEIKFQVNTNIDAVSFEGKMNIPQLNVEKKKIIPG